MKVKIIHVDNEGIDIKEYTKKGVLIKALSFEEVLNAEISKIEAENNKIADIKLIRDDGVLSTFLIMYEE